MKHNIDTMLHFENPAAIWYTKSLHMSEINTPNLNTMYSKNNYFELH